MKQIGDITMYVEEGLKQFYVAAAEGWALMPGSRFFVCQETAEGRIQEPFALIYDTSRGGDDVGLIVMPEKSGTPFTEPYYVDRHVLAETETGLAAVAETIIAAVLDDVGGDLRRLQEDIEERRKEIIDYLGEMK